MNIKCDYCNKEIKSYHNIFKGYDCNFCSAICRKNIESINYNNDKKLCNYNKWYKSKNIPLIIEPTIKRTQSIIDIDNKYNKNKKYLIENINLHHDQYRNIYQDKYYDNYIIDNCNNSCNNYIIKKLNNLNYIISILAKSMF